MITAHWFSYAGNEGLLPICLEAFRLAVPEARMVVVDDGHNSSSDYIRHVCEYLEADWRTSYFHRAGNLRGADCITGILDELVRSVNEGAEVVIKMDPDTLIFGRSWLDRFWDSTTGLTAADDRDAMYGCCYALGADHVLGLQGSFRQFPAHDYTVEDVAIASRFLRIYGQSSFLRIPMWMPTPDKYGNGPDGIFAAYNWTTSHTPSKLRRYTRDFEIINCGNLLPPGSTWADQATLMQRLCKTVSSPLQVGTHRRRQP